MDKARMCRQISGEIRSNRGEQARRDKPVVEPITRPWDMGQIERPVVLHGVRRVEIGPLSGQPEVLRYARRERDRLLVASRRDMRDRQVR